MKKLIRDLWWAVPVFGAVFIVTLVGVTVLFSGCAAVHIVKPDGTDIFAGVVGSTSVTDFDYSRGDANGIKLKIGEGMNSPKGVPAVVAAGAAAGI